MHRDKMVHTHGRFYLYLVSIVSPLFFSIMAGNRLGDTLNTDTFKELDRLYYL